MLAARRSLWHPSCVAARRWFVDASGAKVNFSTAFTAAGVAQVDVFEVTQTSTGLHRSQFARVGQTRSDVAAAAAAQDPGAVPGEPLPEPLIGSLGPRAFMVAGRYYKPSIGNVNEAAVNERLEAMPLFIPRRLTIDRLMTRVFGAGQAGAVLRLGVYAADRVTGDPTALLLDAGVVTADTTGGKELVISLPVEPGLLWLATVCQGASTTVPTVQKSNSANPPVGMTFADPNGGAAGYQGGRVAGALPSRFPALTTLYVSNLTMIRVA